MKFELNTENKIMSQEEAIQRGFTTVLYNPYGKKQDIVGLSIYSTISVFSLGIGLKLMNIWVLLASSLIGTAGIIFLTIQHVGAIRLSRKANTKGTER